MSKVHARRPLAQGTDQVSRIEPAIEVARREQSLGRLGAPISERVDEIQAKIPADEFKRSRVHVTSITGYTAGVAVKRGVHRTGDRAR